MPKDLQPFVSLHEDEDINLIERNVIFYPGGKILDEMDASLIVTNLRIICLIKNYEGLIFKNFIGYDNTRFEINIDGVVTLNISGRVKKAVKIFTNKLVHPWKGVIHGIGFNSIHKAHSFINVITLLIERKGEKPKLEIILENEDEQIEAEIKMLNNKIYEIKHLLESLDKRFIMGDINEKNYDELKSKYNSILKDYTIKLDEFNN